MTAAERVGDRQAQSGIELLLHASAELGELKEPPGSLQLQRIQTLRGIQIELTTIGGLQKQGSQEAIDALLEGHGIAPGEIASCLLETPQQQLARFSHQRLLLFSPDRQIPRGCSLLNQRIQIAAPETIAALQQPPLFTIEIFTPTGEGQLLLLKSGQLLVNISLPLQTSLSSERKKLGLLTADGFRQTIQLLLNLCRFTVRVHKGLPLLASLKLLGFLAFNRDASLLLVRLNSAQGPLQCIEPCAKRPGLILNGFVGGPAVEKCLIQSCGIHRERCLQAKVLLEG